jgi:hypothetical protein
MARNPQATPVRACNHLKSRKFPAAVPTPSQCRGAVGVFFRSTPTAIFLGEARHG